METVPKKYEDMNPFTQSSYKIGGPFIKHVKPVHTLRNRGSPENQDYETDTSIYKTPCKHIQNTMQTYIKHHANIYKIPCKHLTECQP